MKRFHLLSIAIRPIGAARAAAAANDAAYAGQIADRNPEAIDGVRPAHDMLALFNADFLQGAA
jgi:hypothetical protein